MPDLGWQELIIILIIVVIIFGAGKLPEIGGAMGKSIKEFKKATREVSDEISNAADDTQPARKLPPSGSQAPSEPTVTQSSTTPKA